MTDRRSRNKWGNIGLVKHCRCVGTDIMEIPQDSQISADHEVCLSLPHREPNSVGRLLAPCGSERSWIGMQRSCDPFQ
jgi:hypothetical protein